MVQTQRKISAFITAVYVMMQFFTFSPVSYAKEMPSKEELRNSVINDVVTGMAAPKNGSSSEIVNGGDNNNSSTNTNNNTNTGVSNQNDADVNQEVNAVANTGYNEASRNISIGGNAGIINTGDATTNVNGTVNANNNETSIYGEGSNCGNDSDVANVGDNNTFSSNSNCNTQTFVQNGNRTTIRQAANTTANTGHNVAERNLSIGGGQAGLITTGAANSNVSFMVTANGNVTLIGGNDPDRPWHNGSIVIANGGNFNNFNDNSNTSHNYTVNNNNRAVLSQICGAPLTGGQVAIGISGCYSNTGYNTSTRNIGFGQDVGVINTSDATVDVNMVANANSNSTQVRGGGTGSGSSTEFANIGDNNNVNNNSNNTSNTGVSNNNSAQVNQKVNAYANTGHNKATRNICFGCNAGIINTGNATINVNMVTNVNSNKTGVASPAAGGTSSQSGTNSNFLNSGDSNNINTNTNNNTNTGVENNNVLQLLQEIFGWANSGLNNAARNLGIQANAITTGDADTKGTTNALANNSTTQVDTHGTGARTIADPCSPAHSTSYANIANVGDNNNFNINNNHSVNTNVNTINKAHVFQNFLGKADTGNNLQTRVIGGASMITGPAAVAANMSVNVNTSKTTVDCNSLIAAVQPTPAPQNPSTPSNPQSSGGTGGSSSPGGSSSSTGGGEVLGAAVTQLPRTGTSENIMIALVSLSALGLGVYLRKYKNPNIAY